MKISIELMIKIPEVPNFILTSNGETSFPVSDFSDAQLEEIGGAWTKELKRKARAKLRSNQTSSNRSDQND